MPAGASPATDGLPSAPPSASSHGDVSSSHLNNNNKSPNGRLLSSTDSSASSSVSLKPLSSSSNNGQQLRQNGSNNQLHHPYHPQTTDSHNFLAAPPADVGPRRTSMRSATAAGPLHQQSTRRTLRNINAIRFLRSIKVDGEPGVFTEADEHSSHQSQGGMPNSASNTSSALNMDNENVNAQQQQGLQKKLSSGMPGSEMTGASPPISVMIVDAENEAIGGSGIPLQLLGDRLNEMNVCQPAAEDGRRTSSRNGSTTPLDVQVAHPMGSFSSNESPSRGHHLDQAGINVIPPTPTLPSMPGSESKHQKSHDHDVTRGELDDDSLPFFASAEDISPISRSPRRTSGGNAGADYSRYHHSHHHHYQPYQNTHRSPPRSVPVREVRISDQVRFKHPRDEELRCIFCLESGCHIAHITWLAYEVGDQDISSKSFRLRHASQREGSNAAGSAMGSFFQEDSVFSSGGRNLGNSESREISFSELLVVTANALCRSFADGTQHPHIQQHQSLLVASPQHGPSSAGNKGHPHPRTGQGEVEIRLYEYDPEKLDSPTFLQSVNRCPVGMPSYSVTILGYYDPSSAKKLLNDQFKERFPDIQLTFTKMRSLKREMKKIALKCNLDLWCIAQSYVFFEKLILKHYIKKPNRKMCAGSCLLLSAKLNDIRKTKIPALIQEIESTFRIDREDLFTCEFNVFLALDFTLMIPDCEVIPHLIRLIELQHQSTGGAYTMGSSTSSAALQHGSPQSFALLQQHMQQHVHMRAPAPGSAAAPTSTSSALQTSSGNGSNGHSLAIVQANSNCSLIPYSVKSFSNVTN